MGKIILIIIIISLLLTTGCEESKSKIILTTDKNCPYDDGTVCYSTRLTGDIDITNNSTDDTEITYLI